MAKVVDVKAKIVAMLDDFLLVVPKLSAETDADTLRRGKQAGVDFDKLLKRLNLPKAPTKDQGAAFSTVWCGIEFFSKTRLVGIPEAKWTALHKWMQEKVQLVTREDPPTIEAGTLRSLLGKFCHAMLVWPAGRPCLYVLWRLLFRSALFHDRERLKLRFPRQKIKLTAECIGSLLIWKKRLCSAAPRRRIIPCSIIVPSTWVLLLRYAIPLRPTECQVLIATPSTCWSPPKSCWTKETRSHHKDTMVIMALRSITHTRY